VPAVLTQRSAELFFPSRCLDVEEATGTPRLTTGDVFASKPRNGLFCGNNPVNWSDPYGLDVTVSLYSTNARVYDHIGLGIDAFPTQTQGFRPQYLSFTQGFVGEISPDNPANFLESLTIATTPVQDAKIAAAFQQFQGTPYALARFNCSYAVAQALRAGGVTFKYDLRPSYLFRNLKKASNTKGSTGSRRGSGVRHGGSGGNPNGGFGLPGAGGALPGSLGGATAGTGGDGDASGGGDSSGSSGSPNPYIPSVVAEGDDGKQVNIPYDEH
jgi:hypothetical protein